jgi:hypothetical protein
MITMEHDMPNEKDLIALYNREMKAGHHGTAGVAVEAIQAVARAQGAVAQARRLAALANEL